MAAHAARRGVAGAEASGVARAAGEPRVLGLEREEVVLEVMRGLPAAVTVTVSAGLRELAGVRRLLGAQEIRSVTAHAIL